MRKSLVVLFVIILVSGCRESKKEDNKTADSVIRISGPTMGTSYNITYLDSLKRNFTSEIDSILIKINNAVSTYIPSSVISRINSDSLGTKTEVLEDGKITQYIKYREAKNFSFTHNYKVSEEIFRSTHGYFDPTIMPLVNYWGFGYKNKLARSDLDSSEVKKIKETVGLEKWSYSESQDSFTIIKQQNSELDFSAIAKGYAVDELSKFLISKDIINHVVDIGGEIFCSGKKQEKLWTVGINRPVKEASLRSTDLVVELSDRAMASSGNYRNFYEVAGETYGHEINPHSGYPEKNDLLGVSVIAPDCMRADALATAFMVLGRDNAAKIVEDFVDIEAVFFYSDDGENIKKQFSSGFQSHLVKTDS